MSQRLSTSTTFQSLETRVDALEQLTPLSATLENNSYLSAKRHDGVVTRIAGITAADTLYIGSIDAPVSSVIITAGGSASVEVSSLGANVWGSLTVAGALQAPVVFAPSSNGFGGAIEILGSGVAGHTGIVQFLKLDGTRNGYVGFNAESGPMHYGSDTGAGHYFEGGIISPDPAMLFGLRFNSVDGIVDFDAGDYLYYSRSNDEYLFMIGGAAQFAVNPSGTFVANVLTIGDGNFAVNLNGGMPTFQFDGGDYIQFNRSSNAYAFNIGAATKAALDSSGNFTAAGSIAPSNDANFLIKTASGNPQIVFDSGGDQISYDRTANKYYFAIGGVNVASIDASGNMRLKGTLTQSVTP